MNRQHSIAIIYRKKINTGRRKKNSLVLIKCSLWRWASKGKHWGKSWAARHSNLLLAELRALSAVALTSVLRPLVAAEAALQAGFVVLVLEAAELVPDLGLTGFTMTGDGVDFLEELPVNVALPLDR